MEKNKNLIQRINKLGNSLSIGLGFSILLSPGLLGLFGGTGLVLQNRMNSRIHKYETRVIKKADTNKDGKLEVEELLAVYRKLGLNGEAVYHKLTMGGKI